MRIIKVNCCIDCPYKEERTYMTPGFYKPYCTEQQKDIPIKTYTKRKIYSKCRLEKK